jgi:hypothetical protein
MANELEKEEEGGGEGLEEAFLKEGGEGKG